MMNSQGSFASWLRSCRACHIKCSAAVATPDSAANFDRSCCGCMSAGFECGRCRSHLWKTPACRSGSDPLLVPRWSASCCCRAARTKGCAATPPPPCPAKAAAAVAQSRWGSVVPRSWARMVRAVRVTAGAAGARPRPRRPSLVTRWASPHRRCGTACGGIQQQERVREGMR